MSVLPEKDGVKVIDMGEDNTMQFIQTGFMFPKDEQMQESYRRDARKIIDQMADEYHCRAIGIGCMIAAMMYEFGAEGYNGKANENLKL